MIPNFQLCDNINHCTLSRPIDYIFELFWRNNKVPIQVIPNGPLSGPIPGGDAWLVGGDWHWPVIKLKLFPLPVRWRARDATSGGSPSVNELDKYYNSRDRTVVNTVHKIIEYHIAKTVTTELAVSEKGYPCLIGVLSTKQLYGSYKLKA